MRKIIVDICNEVLSLFRPIWRTKYEIVWARTMLVNLFLSLSLSFSSV